MLDQDRSELLRDVLLEAHDTGTALRIVGGGSKDFYGREPTGTPYGVAEHRGIVDYQPTELVVTVRAGTPIRELQQVLADHGQTLAFEPPRLAGQATVGGTVATNFSGPGRPFYGSVRDFVLGVRLLSGRGQSLSFGGQVMKNVAGYDLSRLSCGAMGTLGVILQVSLKVLPLPETEQTLGLAMTPTDAIAYMSRCAGRPHPISAMAFDGELVRVRLAGATLAVKAAAGTLGGDVLDDGAQWWHSLREFEHPFLSAPGQLWRLAVKSGFPAVDDFDGEWLIDWGGGLRWLRTEAPAERVRAAAVRGGGHALVFRGGNRSADVFQPLDPVLMRLHGNIKKAMDPAGVLNPGRLYSGL